VRAYFDRTNGLGAARVAPEHRTPYPAAASSDLRAVRRQHG
jgi:hypothetical protein